MDILLIFVKVAKSTGNPVQLLRKGWIMSEKKAAKKVATKAVKKAAAAPAKKAVTKSATKETSAPKVAKKATKKVAKKVSAQRKLRTVELNYFSPASTTVAVAGTFNNWDPKAGAMKKKKDGVWTIKLELEPGNYEYKLVFDDASWECDPAAPVIHSEYGPNNLLQID